MSQYGMFRAILRELSMSTPQIEARNNSVWLYIKDTLRQGKRPHEQYLRTLQTFLYYIQSSRLHRDLLSTYQGKGERTVEESAKLVGLSLPQEKQEQRNTNNSENTTFLNNISNK